MSDYFRTPEPYFGLPKFDPSGYNQTIMEPLGFLLVVALGLATLLLPRRLAVIPFVITLCFVSMRQRIAVFELDFNVVRILVMFGWLRLISRGETGRMKWMPLDTAVASFGALAAITFVLRKASLGAVIYRSGWLFDIFGIYFMFRYLLRDWRDVETVIHALMWMTIPTAIAFTYEYWSGSNPFYAFGGVSEFSPIREGRVRATGVFGHPILAGCFWASLTPLFASTWWRGSGLQRALVPISLIAVVIIVYDTSSSSPALVLMAAIFGFLMWPIRGYLREARWGILAVAIGLHMVMKAPVWHLIGRLDLVTGSTGYHRYALIDEAIRHFPEWFLLGTDRSYTWGWGLGDVTNHYLFIGAESGFFAMVLFLVVLTLAFQRAGLLRRVAAGSPRYLALSWGLGVSLFANLFGFFAVAYTSQLLVMVLLLLALVAAPALSHRPAPARIRAPSLHAEVV